MPMESEMPGHAVVIVDRASARYRYLGGERTTDRIVSAAGVPLTRISGSGTIGDTWMPDLAIDVPDAVAEGVSPGDVVIATDHGSVVLTAGDYGAIRVATTSDAIRVVGRASAIIAAASSAPARPAKSVDAA